MLAETGKWDKYREEDYKKNAHIRVGKEENDTEVNIRLFHYENYFMDSIAILSVCSVAVYLAERRMKIRI